jgi:apolipoprotein N-acyltransferase
MGFRRFYKSYFLHETLKLLTICWSMGFTVIICFIWWWAFFNGDETLVTINRYDEKWFELVLGLILIPMMFYGFYWFLKDFAAKKRRLRKSVRWFMSLEKVETL